LKVLFYSIKNIPGATQKKERKEEKGMHALEEKAKQSTRC
jgi:hypothetical protein